MKSYYYMIPIQTQMELVETYLAQLTESQKTAYLIAKEHLGTSFNVKKSNGFIEWLKKSKR